MEAIAKNDTRRSMLRKISLNEKFYVNNPFMRKHDPQTMEKSVLHQWKREYQRCNQQSREERINHVLDSELRDALTHVDKPVGIGPSLRDNGDWYTELSDIADSLGIPLTRIPFSQISLLKTNWYRLLIMLVLYWEVELWEIGPYDQFLWLQKDAVNERARKFLDRKLKEIVLQVYDMIAKDSEYDATEVVEAGRKLIQSGEIAFQCDFDNAQITFSMKDWETVKLLANDPILMEIMEKVIEILKAYATDIIDYAVYKAVEKPM